MPKMPKMIGTQTTFGPVKLMQQAHELSHRVMNHCSMTGLQIRRMMSDLRVILSILHLLDLHERVHTLFRFVHGVVLARWLGTSSKGCVLQQTSQLSAHAINDRMEAISAAVRSCSTRRIWAYKSQQSHTEFQMGPHRLDDGYAHEAAEHLRDHVAEGAFGRTSPSKATQGLKWGHTALTMATPTRPPSTCDTM